MNLRLFAIRNLATGRIIPNLYFPSKPAAKLERTAQGEKTHCVTYGPDHRKFRG